LIIGKLEWLATTDFASNNKVHIATKLSLFKVNYEREPRIGFEIRKKEKYVKKMKKAHEKVKAVLTKSQEKMKKYADRNRKEAVEYKVGDKVLLSTKDLMWQMRNRETKKLIEKFMELYRIKKIIPDNMVELELLILIKIHLVFNMSRIVLY